MNQNARERLFFKDIKLHRSVTFQKRLDKEQVQSLRKKYAKEYLERVEKKHELREKHKSIFYQFISIFHQGL